MNKTYRYVPQPPGYKEPYRAPVWSEEQKLCAKWLGNYHSDYANQAPVIHLARALESMSQEIERLKAKLAKQDD